MIQIVNETKYMLRLMLYEDNKNVLWISAQSPKKNKYVIAFCKVAKGLEDEVKENFRRMTKENDYLKIPPFRTTKFVPSSKPGHISLYPKIAEFGCEFQSIPTGLSDKAAYFHPKGIIVIITDAVSETSKPDHPDYIETCVCENQEGHSQVESVGSCHFWANDEKEGALFQLFAYDVHKWANMKENTYLLLPNMERLVFGEVSIKTKEGKDKTINALIRCDANGTPLQRASKKKEKKKKK